VPAKLDLLELILNMEEPDPGALAVARDQDPLAARGRDRERHDRRDLVARGVLAPSRGSQELSVELERIDVKEALAKTTSKRGQRLVEGGV